MNRVIGGVLGAIVLAIAGMAIGQGSPNGAAPASLAGSADNPERIDVTSKDYDTFYMKTLVGSYKLLDGEGKVTISWTGTLLLSQYKGRTPVITGQVRKEFEKGGKVAYFGTGKIELLGRFRAIQWFGSDMNTVWRGKGKARMFGEFDRFGNTGQYWFEGTKPMPWTQYGNEVLIPSPLTSREVTPRRGGG